LRRLFWTFAPGVPGAALLILRIVAAAALVSMGLGGLSTHPAPGSATFFILQIGAGLFLLVGLWTPLAGLVVLIIEGWHVLSPAQEPWTHILLATLGGAFALLGPGAWSVDARLFGWKRIDIRDRRPTEGSHT
jgi:hypothetical protein